MNYSLQPAMKFIQYQLVYCLANSVLREVSGQAKLWSSLLRRRVVSLAIGRKHQREVSGVHLIYL